jgi:anthranilate synthase component 1
MYFVLARELIIFDHVRHRIKIVINTYISPQQRRIQALRRKYREAVERIESLEHKLKLGFASLHAYPRTSKLYSRERLKFRSNISKRAFKNIVKKAKEYIRSGEIIQVVLSQRFSSPIFYSPFDIYRALRSINPSPYMYYLDFGHVHIVGSSPEMFVRCEKGKVQMRPIAGTRRRGKDKKEDLKLERNLLSDEKERAEHLMLVDLGRNDLGRVCKYGTVKVDEFMVIERYSHVMHIVSNVQGKLDRKKDIFDVVSSTFPAGTVTGAPKIRAMEIIDELEKLSRGPYAGCVGYFSLSGNLDTCITIRTIIIKGKTAYIQAGAGIVADSDPEKEYFETLNKAKAQMEALTSITRIL